MTNTDILVYGANGYTGALIVERAVANGLRPVVAGRSADAVQAIATRFGLQSRVFGLDDPAKVREGIRGAKLVLHCAGPYSKTSRPMLDACFAERAHYLDITGEYTVLEAVLARDAEARAAGIVAIPAVGFDVVPTDCMAASLAAALPSATRLELAFGGGMQPSAGTAKTTMENLHVGSVIRENGALVALSKPRTREVPFAGGTRFAMSLPWGDIVTAYHSTRIPNITVYIAVPKMAARGAALLGFVSPVLKLPGVISFLQRVVEARATGPSEEERRNARMSVWGRAEDDGHAVEGQLELPDGYELTVVAALASAERVLSGAVSPGATTPSRAFGKDFVTKLPGVGALNVTRIS